MKRILRERPSPVPAEADPSYEITPCEAARLNDRTMRRLIFELLSQNSIHYGTIDRLLRFVGGCYHVSRAYIIEFSEGGGKILHSFSWCAEGIRMDMDRFCGKDPADWNRYVSRFNADGIFYCGNAYSHPACHCEKQFCKSEDTEATLQCAFFSNGELSGIAGFDECSKSRIWTQEEISSLTFIARIVGTHLIHIRTRQQMERIAYTDMLTGVKNFESFHLDAQKILIQNPDKRFALLYCDIDKFRDVNDTVGHENGDRILCHMANMLQNMLSENEAVCRISADTFAVLIRYRGDRQFRERWASFVKKFQSIGPLVRFDREMSVTCGVYIIQGDASISSMIDNANAARKQIKGFGPQRIAYYDEMLHQKLLKKKELEGSMLSSLQNEDFLVYLQPKYYLASRMIGGVEALVRWNHPAKGMIYPADFIPLFERNGFIVDLDHYVFEKVCALIRKWMDKNLPVVPVSVNFSRAHLPDTNFIPRLVGITEKYRIPTHLVEIELTESAFIDKRLDIMHIAEKLKEHGFPISMDDFGSGYSSLNSLKELPVDILKLDKEFFKNRNSTEKEQIIISGFVAIAKKLHMKVVCEGVETESQAAFLQRIECDMAQGYLFAKPVPVDEFEKLLWKAFQIPGSA